MDAPADPVYANVGRPPAPSPRAPADPPPDSAWEAHTDAASGRRYYYNRDTGASTWEPPGEASPAASPASAGSRESLDSEWDQYWDEESRRVFFYNPLTGETAWEDAPGDGDEDAPEDAPDMQPGPSPGSPWGRRVRGGAGSGRGGPGWGPRAHPVRGRGGTGAENLWPLQPPTPEADYPESLSSYPEEDDPSAGWCGEPSPTSPLSPPPGWSCHLGPDQQTLFTNHFTGEQVGRGWRGAPGSSQARAVLGSAGWERRIGP